MTKVAERIRSIDAFRAVTMFFMIFVNDIDSMPNTPIWLHHAGEKADALGFADIIFPAFLFIVGLSIPFAFKNRELQGHHHKTPWRIIMRAFLLIFIGFFHANMETYNEATALLPQPVWESLLTISFFLIFLDYSPQTSAVKRYLLQGLGIVLLVILSLLYKTSDPGHTWLHLTWWGILGLIGWAYLICALIYYYTGGQLWVQAAVWLFFMFFNIDFHYGWLNFLRPMQKYVWLAGDGAMQAFTMAGVFVSVLYMRLKQRRDINMLWIGMILMSVILFNLGFIVRYLTGGISKANDTPSWVLICTGIALVVYAFFIYLVDFKHKYQWFDIIKPAGTNTFMCYLVPYIFYPLYQLSNIGYPEYLSQGVGGLVKGLVLSLLMVWITGLLEKVNIRLKI